jgi:hypothetical protein
MQFTGKNLEWVAYGLALALNEVHNQIATCPDVIKEADYIAELEAEKAYLTKLHDRVAAKT